jgi:hypothetical protein
MIRLTLPVDGLIQRLRRRAERLAARQVRSVRRRTRRSGHKWRSATALWPDFTDFGPRS